MSQQINLFNPILLRQRKYFSALTMVQALYALVILLATAGAAALAARGARGGAAAGEAARATAGDTAEGRPITWRHLVRLGSWIQVTTLFGLVQNHVDKIILGRLASLALVPAALAVLIVLGVMLIRH